MVGALILAGGAKMEAQVDIGGRPMLTRVVQAAQDCSDVDDVVVVGPEALVSCLADTRARRVDSGHSLVENIRIGMDALADSTWVLVLTSDIPLVEPAALADFIARCDRQQGSFFYPIVRRQTYEERFPGSRRTYAKLRDGVFTGGNIFLTRRDIVPQALTLLERLYAARKNPLKLAQILGMVFLLKLVLGRLTIQELERRMSDMVGAPGMAVITEYAEIGFDVDRPEDVELARAFS